MNNLERERIPLHRLLLGGVAIDGHDDRPGGVQNEDVGRRLGIGEPIDEEDGDGDVVVNARDGGRAQRGPARLPRAGAEDVIPGALLVDPALDGDGLDRVGRAGRIERSR